MQLWLKCGCSFRIFIRLKTIKMIHSFVLVHIILYNNSMYSQMDPKVWNLISFARLYDTQGPYSYIPLCYHVKQHIIKTLNNFIVEKPRSSLLLFNFLKTLIFHLSFRVFVFVLVSLLLSVLYNQANDFSIRFESFRFVNFTLCGKGLVLKSFLQI